MEIKRIDDYNDERFEKDILCRHGAYIIDNEYPCEFLIISEDSAVIHYHDYSNLDILKEIIEEFRFHSKNIVKYYDNNNKLIIEFEEINIYNEKITNLQPSQFYIDEAKLLNIKKWAKNKGHFIIPIMKYAGKSIILDGHTRLYLARTLGFEEVFVFEDNADDSIFYFVKEAEKRNIFIIDNLQKLPHKEYEELWNAYCDRYFMSK